MSELLREDQQPCPWCSCTKVKLSISEICCPIQWSVRARCDDCGAEEPNGSGVYDSQADAIQEALDNWNDRQSAPEKEWQPIDSTPTGELVLLAYWDGVCWQRRVGYKSPEYGDIVMLGANREIPTRWMPLPLPLPPSVEVKSE